jgi:tetratricopeptide (TPR) repeat protein
MDHAADSSSYDTATAVNQLSHFYHASGKYRISHTRLTLKWLSRINRARSHAEACGNSGAAAACGRTNFVSELRFNVSASSQQKISPLNPLQDSYMRLEEAERLRQQGKLERAQKQCESLVRQYPDYMGALHTLGLIHADRGHYERALDCLVRAAMRNPRNWSTLTALSGVYLKLGASEMAAQTLERARAINPQDPAILVTLGEIYREEREYELGQQAFRQALALEPHLVPAALGLARICSSIGDHAEAARVFADLMARGVRDVDLIFALTSLPVTVPGIDALTELEKVTKSDTRGEFENTAGFARAAGLDRLRRHSEAWECLLPVNRTIFQTMRKDFEEARESQRTSLKNLQDTHATLAPRDGPTSAISLFILGTSRSGKTSMEQLVATLEGVKRGFENPIVENAIARTFHASALLSSTYFEYLPPQLDSLCRDNYLEELSRRAGRAKVFTNTHPARISDAARVASVFPNVRFIFLKRNLDDTLLRIYMRQYHSGNSYSYDLTAARDYIGWYHQMIDLMSEKYPDITRVIHYEDIVANPAGALRVAADLCDLPMHDRPLPSPGDDRGCAEPYRQLMAAELAR